MCPARVLGDPLHRLENVIVGMSSGSRRFRVGLPPDDRTGQTRGMELAQLRCFLAVAEELHFGRAAARLHLTPSPVSRAVKDLERDIGTGLFVRHYHQVELTPAGRHLANRVAALLPEIDRLGPDTLAVARRHLEVRVGGAHLAPSEVLDDVLACAGRTFPEVRVNVVVGQSTELLADLRHGTLDVAVVHVPIDDPDLDVLEMASYTIDIAMRHDDDLAERREIAVSELADRTVVLVSDSVQPVVMRWMKDWMTAAGITRLVHQPDADLVKLVEHVRRTGSVTLTGSQASGAGRRLFEGPDFALVPLANGPVVKVGAAWLRRRAEEPVVARLLAALRAHHEESGAVVAPA